jgi:RNA polymerase sigma-70 factor (ECF subfamily)
VHRQPSDEEIIARVLDGDRLAFEDLVKRHQAQVARIVGNKIPPQDVPEVAQEVFIKAFTSLPDYRPLKPFAHWLSVLAVRTCHDYWRSHYRRREVALEALAPEPNGGARGVAANSPVGEGTDPYGQFEDWELLDWALGHLSPGDRMALTLVHLEGYTLEEAAEALGWTRSMVKVRSFRARRKLHRLITQALGGEVEDEQA